MPNLVRDPDLSSDERDEVLAIASLVLGTTAGTSTVSTRTADLRLLARAVLRYVPAGVPANVPSMVASSSDRTMPAGQVLGVIDENSSGVCEPTGDEDAATRARRIDHTAMHRSQDGQAFIVKRGAANDVSIPCIPDITRK